MTGFWRANSRSASADKRAMPTALHRMYRSVKTWTVVMIAATIATGARAIRTRAVSSRAGIDVAARGGDRSASEMKVAVNIAATNRATGHLRNNL